LDEVCNFVKQNCIAEGNKQFGFSVPISAVSKNLKSLANCTKNPVQTHETAGENWAKRAGSTKIEKTM
jgi:hypothetical protein